MRRALLLAPALLAGLIGTTPAHALSVGTAGVTGGITVYPDFTACVNLTFPTGHVFVGQFTAVGELQGPSTKAGTVRGALPIVAVGSWSGCIQGSYAGATVGEGKFVLDAHSTTEDHVEVQQCVVNNGVLACF
jgi:hypothetical protein